MFDNDKTQAMFIFILLSTLLILSGIPTADDGLDWDSPKLPASAIITKNIRRHASCIEPVFYGDFVQSSQRRLLEHPRRVKQVYRSHDYNVARGYRRPRNKLDEGRPYHSSAVNNDEDEDEEEDEEEEEEVEENNEENLDDEDETAEQGEEETVARNRIVRSGYVPFGNEANERERREVARIRSVTEECEDKSTEPSQYYEYETEVRNVASQDARREKRRAMLLAKVLGASLLISLHA